ncbi:MAG: ABC transporter substrate-binding protein [Marinomonas sp.]
MKNRYFHYKKLAIATTLATALCSQQALAENTPFTFITNWYAQAEHGGYYQAVAQGLYKEQGLDVTVRMGGPQINGTQLMLAGQAQCVLTDDIGAMMANKQGIPIKLVATSFQFDPTVVITHSDVDSMEELKSRKVLISSAAHSSWWPWAKKKYGFTDEMSRPYTFNIQPFVLDNNLAQQGYMTSEPYSMKEAGADHKVFSLGKEGYPPYGNSIACRNDVIDKHPEQVTAFLKASMLGWKSFLANPDAASVLIKKDNPNMTDDKIAFSVGLLNSSGIVKGGDAATQGIGVITDERMLKTWQMGVDNDLFSAAEVSKTDFYTTTLIKDIKVLP